MFKEVTPEEADPLSLAGLLWYCYTDTMLSDKGVFVWEPDTNWMPTKAQEQFGDYIFWILLEE